MSGYPNPGSGGGGAPTGPAGGDLAGMYPNPTVEELAVMTAAGDIVYANAADGTLSRLPVGVAPSTILGVAAGVPAWVTPPGFEFGYDQITSSVVIASTTEASGTTIISCGAHIFDGSPVMAEFFTPALYTAAGLANTSIYVSLFEASTQIGRLCSIYTLQGSAGQFLVPGPGKLRFTPTAGSHTYTVTAFSTLTDTGSSVGAGASGTGALVPAYIQFTKV